MHDTTTSVFQHAALSSGLVSAAQLDEAISGLIRSESGVWRTAKEVPDQELSERLVDLGYLNRWQVEQLLLGHTKFKLGPYRIVDAIGKGGMGHVFKGEHELLGRVEAVKVLPLSKSSPEAIASFQREIRVQAQLDHPNLVRVSYADHDGDTYFFVTEYVPGTDLRRLVRRNGPLRAEVAASIIAQTAKGLVYAHRKGLVHRDIKPGNVLVTPEGQVKLTDLGLAWYLMEEIGAVSGGKPGTIVGTSDYLAPETIAEPSRIRPVSDIYSLGATLYYTVTGKVPFPGGKTSDKMRRHLHETPLNPLHFNPDLTPEFGDVIAKLMAKDPNERTPTADKVVEILRPWYSGEATLEFAAARGPLFEGSDFDQSSKAIAPGISETATFESNDAADSLAGQSELPTQLSQGTLPIAAAQEDTVRHGKESDDEADRNTDDRRLLSNRTLLVIAALALGLAGMLCWLLF